ncbi:MAG: putative amidohydrolase YtcJ [Halioglobus sp.]|jgi:predicted amidohydrolase YtcJ
MFSIAEKELRSLRFSSLYLSPWPDTLPETRNKCAKGAARPLQLLLVVVIMVLAVFRANAGPPDYILHNGVVITVNEEQKSAQALAISGRKIVAVGSDEAILPMAGSGTHVLNLKGHAVIPGLIDNHHHFMDKAVDVMLGADVTLTRSIDEMARVIAAKIEQVPPGGLVYTTSGWLQTQFTENRTPTRSDLDPVSPDNPVIVQGGHSLYLNSKALEIAGINRDTLSPKGGTIERDLRTGEPTGRLIENAMSLASQWDLGKADRGQKIEAIRQAQKKMLAVGVTSLREPGISAEDMRAYQQFHQSGELILRVSMNYSLSPEQPIADFVETLSTWGVSTGFGDHRLRLDGIGEFGLDGGFEGALLSESYANTPGGAEKPYYGLQRIATLYFEEAVLAMNRLNWRPSVHVVGDKGLDIVLDAYERANRQQSIKDKRWVVEHAHVTRLDQLDRMRELGVIISTQFHPYMAAGNMAYYWGDERAAQAMRVRDWMDAGLMVGGGSDWSLVPANPFWMLYFWVSRDTRLDGISGPKQAINRQEALRMMTLNNAYITFEEDFKGSIEPGKVADIVVLSDNYLTIPEKEIRDLRALLTIVDGKVVYSDSNGPFNQR